MDGMMTIAAAGGATMASVGVALLLEAALLRVILGAVAKAKVDDEAQRDESCAVPSRASVRRGTCFPLRSE